MSIFIKPVDVQLETVVKRELTCLVSAAVGDWVRINATDSIETITNNTIDNVLGILVSKESTTKCTVVLKGPVDIFSGLDASKSRYFLDPTGGEVDTAPATGNIIELGKPLNSTTLIVDINTIYSRAS